ncbi:MAG: hypothetical protein IIZ39_06595 [Blautia sp.]|nr:hypothetical protein [Blautia sp.]
MQEILTYLMDQGILAERKSIYDDLSLLRSMGMDIRYMHGKKGGYYQAGVRPDSLLGEITQLSMKALGTSAGSVRASVPGGKASGSEMKEVRLCYETEEGHRLLKEYLGVLPDAERREDGVYFVTAQVYETPEFFGWLTAVGDFVRLEEPVPMVERFTKYLDSLREEYASIV